MASYDVDAFVSADVISRNPVINNDLEKRILDYVHELINNGKTFSKCSPLVIADIGCGNGAFTKQLISDKLPPEIQNVSKYLIDPYGNREEGIHTLTDIDFATNYPSNHCDIIICKGVVHLFSNWFNFLKNIERILCANGLFIIVHMSDEIHFPWGKYAQKSFDVSCKAESFQWVNYDELSQHIHNKSSYNIIPNCNVSHFRFKHNISVKKKEWINFIKYKAWSTLQSLNDKQIKYSCDFVNDKFKNDNQNISIDIKWIVSEVRKKQYITQNIKSKL